MKISFESLDKLQTSEYQEYKKLRKKDYNGDTLGMTLLVILHITLSFLVSFRWQNETDGQVSLFIILLIFPYCWLPVAFLAIILEDAYKSVFCYFSHKSSSYVRYKKLEEKFLSIEKTVKGQLTHYVDYGLYSSIDQLRKNLENRAVYANLLNDFLSNHSFVKEASNALELRNYEDKYKNALKRADVWFEDDLLKIKEKVKPQIPVRERFFYNLGKKVKTTFKPRKSVTKNSFTSLGNIKPQTNTTTKPKIEPRKAETKKPKEKQGSLFSEGFLKNTPVVPTKKNRIIRPRTIKASDKFWEELGKKRIEIGKKGEMLVMEYERKRIISEEGRDFLNRLQYSALVEGDGLGYDITSFKGGSKIYIEVKTTTGSFWNGLFFTQTELETMEKLGNKYYLYRIYEFDKLTNIGKLKIFKGCEEIKSQFDFSPQTYVLKPKG